MTHLKPEVARQILRSCGQTQTQLAALFGVQQPVVSRWLSGEREMVAPAIVLLEHLLQDGKIVVKVSDSG